MGKPRHSCDKPQYPYIRYEDSQEQTTCTSTTPEPTFVKLPSYSPSCPEPLGTTLAPTEYVQFPNEQDVPIGRESICKSIEILIDHSVTKGAILQSLPCSGTSGASENKLMSDSDLFCLDSTRNAKIISGSANTSDLAPCECGDRVPVPEEWDFENDKVVFNSNICQDNPFLDARYIKKDVGTWEVTKNIGCGILSGIYTSRMSVNLNTFTPEDCARKWSVEASFSCADNPTGTYISNLGDCTNSKPPTFTYEFDLDGCDDCCPCEPPPEFDISSREGFDDNMLILLRRTAPCQYSFTDHGDADSPFQGWMLAKDDCPNSCQCLTPELYWGEPYRGTSSSKYSSMLEYMLTFQQYIIGSPRTLEYRYPTDTNNTEYAYYYCTDRRILENGLHSNLTQDLP